MSREKRAFRKINRILSKLDPDTAAALARRFMEFYGRPVSAQRQEAGAPAPRQADRPAPIPAARTVPTPAEKTAPIPAEQPAGEDTRPSFLQTQYRMDVGKQLVDYLNKEETQDND
jgi:hypothetical protein